MQYSEQLLDPKWLTKRAKILKRDFYACTSCKSRENLHVHHIYYVRGKKAWEYPNSALTTFCSDCHNRWHKDHDIEVREAVWKKGGEYKAPRKKKARKDRVKSVKNPNKKKKVKGLDPNYRYRHLDEAHKRKLVIRDNKKIELIKEYTEDYRDIFEKTRSLTLEELRRYLYEEDIKEGF